MRAGGSRFREEAGRVVQMTGYPFASMITDSSEPSFPFSLERETEMEKPSKWQIQRERERIRERWV